VRASQGEGDEQITHIFDPPAKGEIVRLNERTRVYHKEHGWMTPAEARAKIREWEQHAVDQGRDPKARSYNGNKIVLSFFDLSGEWSLPWDQAGYQVWRFDIQNDPDLPRMGDVNNFSTDFFNDWFGNFEGLDVHAILAACPCTDFAVIGARHFAAKDKDGRTVASVKLVQQTLAAIEYFKPAVWAIENPVGASRSSAGCRRGACRSTRTMSARRTPRKRCCGAASTRTCRLPRRAGRRLEDAQAVRRQEPRDEERAQRHAGRILLLLLHGEQRNRPSGDDDCQQVRPARPRADRAGGEGWRHRGADRRGGRGSLLCRPRRRGGERGAQALITPANPLAPRATDTARALQRKADEGLKPTKEQKPVGSDGGLFDTQDTTGDLFADPVEKAKAILQQGLDALNGKQEPEEKPQPAKQLEDAGEKIGGARKDVWAQRGLALSDLEEHDARRGSSVRHQGQRLAEARLCQAGRGRRAAPEVAAAVKLLRDSLAAKPKTDSDEGRRDYIEGLHAARDVLAEVKTVDDVRAVQQQALRCARCPGTATRWIATEEQKAASASSSPSSRAVRSLQHRLQDAPQDRADGRAGLADRQG
jgi:hypothetical protein